MSLGRDVHLIPVKLDALRPTQMTVGYREVKAKRKHWKTLGKRERKAAIDSHWFPAVVGPGGRHFITDHHHLGLALIEEGETTVKAMLLKDLSWLDETIFWRMMEHNQWVHPFGADGARCDYADLPKVLTGLEDDPYRSLAGELRTAGGYAKDATPFSEFLWADYLRLHVTPDQIRKNFDKALDAAMKRAHEQDARYLPGWSGVIVTKT
ncbi:chromosome partitioning protein ParB [Burkholderia ubonensis]|uniref:Chromosome partitioning protein ParB n=1 Tax=Burkholderia ubonensis TaxID=101571 RepID=A0AB73FTM3_9BURK|nr:ParB-like protein [Burkholderia ubonensis]KVK94961.1 chromosome partitioning protein ParB [Burkholderia ubonensis]KVL72662.1 chromosome partitioning protein ParB [Burkholderia ubonensis]KVL79766.1 chromosome partitioning protein ParB [Burkholderia ubonensis]KVL79857.1 chromosome partitioning protein ParB [Burkholderia ubonensis]KVL88151.1 chromosome partitioning protein ParB [Burkholderia ubonensis]